MNKKDGLLSKVALGLVLAFFYIPIIYMIIFSFNESKSLSMFTGFSMKWYRQLIQNATMMESIYYTVLIAVIATVVSTVIGTLASIGLSKSRKIVREVVLQVNNLPVMNPEIVTAIGLMLLFTSLKINKGFTTLLLAHIAFCIPYVILSVMPRLRRLDPNLADAAMDLGATPLYALWKVIVPQLMPGIVAGALIAFTMSFDDFVISYFVTGGGVNNISIMVYTMSKRINPTINSLSTLIVIAIAVILTISNLISKRNASTKSKLGWKGYVILGLCVCLGLFGLKTLGTNKGSKEIDPMKEFGCNTLNVFNWGEYIGEDTIRKFEEKYNVKVNYSVFASNEEMYTKLLGGEAYDILVPSDYMIQRLIEEDLLQPIHIENIPNLDYVGRYVTGLQFDPDNTYSVPYLWGSVGILYDKTVIDEKDLKEQGWDIFLNTKYKGDIYVYDSERDAFMMALKALGYSMNTTDEQEIKEAYDWLLQVKNTMEPVFVTDEVIDGMINGEKAMAQVYSGDAAYAQSENEDLGYYEPMQGTNIWSDAMVIPANATCPALAEAWMNFNLEYDVAYDNAYYIGYSSGVEQVYHDLANGEYKDMSAYIPREDYILDEAYTYDNKIKKILSEYWIRVKAGR